MSFKPLGERVLVRPDKAADEINGIAIVRTTEEKQDKGTVVAIGDELNQAGAVRSGMHVFYTPYGGSEIDVDGETLVILRYNELLGYES